jgi:TetR/AcrR family transcriptional regulator
MKDSTHSIGNEQSDVGLRRREAGHVVPPPSSPGHAGSEPPRKGRLRKEQQRSVDTRRAIMDAALAEFAEKGFAAASIREIAARVDLPHTTVTHHYKSKDLLWQAVAEDLFATIRNLWESEPKVTKSEKVFDRLLGEYVGFLEFTLVHPLFHQFLAREKWPGNPRLPWLAENILAPLLQHLLPEIRAAQSEGSLPPGNPILLHYVFLALMSVPSIFGAEMEFTAGMKSSNPLLVSEYTSLIRSIFSMSNASNDK